jgi:hypothetical protein
MIATDFRPNPPDNAMLVAAILGTDLYSFVQASFPIVSGGVVFCRTGTLRRSATSSAKSLKVRRDG